MGENVRPWPPTKKIPSNSDALPRKEESFSVFSHRDCLELRKETLILSSLAASMEEGSSGAFPPAGEAMVREACGERISWGWANSDCGCC